MRMNTICSHEGLRTMCNARSIAAYAMIYSLQKDPNRLGDLNFFLSKKDYEHTAPPRP